MKISQIHISNFRKIRSAVIDVRPRSVLVGQTGSGRSTVIEALRLVLDVDRNSKKCSIDEFDFFDRNYVDANGIGLEVRVKILLNDLSDSDIDRFSDHIVSSDAGIRNGKSRPDDIREIDRSSLFLPVIFIAKYDVENQEFVSGTYFDAPIPKDIGAHDVKLSLGGGRATFEKADKQHCGFIFLRSQRTSPQLLGLSSGTLLGKLVDLIDCYEPVGMPEPIGQYLSSTAHGRNPTLAPKRVSDIFVACDLPLTRECARFILRDIAYGDQRTKISNMIQALVKKDAGFDLPVLRHSRSDTSALMINLITSIAALKRSSSVSLIIEQMEEDLPPHLLSQLIRLITAEMDQVIVTTHSASVTRQFKTSDLLVLGTDKCGDTYAATPSGITGLEDSPCSPARQIKAGVLGVGVLVVEGIEMASVCRETSVVMARSRHPHEYLELADAGVTLLPLSDVYLMPECSTVLNSIGMHSFTLFLKPEKDFNDAQMLLLEKYSGYWELNSKSVESLIVEETSASVHRRFLEAASMSDTYPWHCGSYDAMLQDDQEVRALTLAVLHARHGCSDDMVGLFIRQCQCVAELPATIQSVLDEISWKIQLRPE